MRESDYIVTPNCHPITHPLDSICYVWMQSGQNREFNCVYCSKPRFKCRNWGTFIYSFIHSCTHLYLVICTTDSLSGLSAAPLYSVGCFDLRTMMSCSRRSWLAYVSFTFLTTQGFWKNTDCLRYLSGLEGGCAALKEAGAFHPTVICRQIALHRT